MSGTKGRQLPTSADVSDQELERRERIAFEAGYRYGRIQKGEVLAARVEELENWNHSVAVCREHTAEIVGDDCVVCENERLQARVDELEDVCGSRGMKIVELVDENRRLREALERARPYITGHKLGLRRNLEWWVEAVKEKP